MKTLSLPYRYEDLWGNKTNQAELEYEFKYSDDYQTVKYEYCLDFDDIKHFLGLVFSQVSNDQIPEESLFIFLAKIAGEDDYNDFDWLGSIIDSRLSRDQHKLEPLMKEFCKEKAEKEFRKVFQNDVLGDPYEEREYWETEILENKQKVKEAWWDDKTSFDYRTQKVEQDDIFDTTTLGGFSDIARCIPGSKDYQYMIDEKNKKGEIVQMSPKEYYDICAKRFETTVENLIQSRIETPEYIESLKKVITEKHKKFPMCFIDYTSPKSQEGLHRMYVAAQLFGWDHLFPVLVVTWADEKKHEQEVEEQRVYEIESKVEKALENALRYTYDDIEEFKEHLQYDINRAFYVYNNEPDQQFELKIDENNINIIVEGVTVSVPLEELKFKGDAENIDLTDYYVDDSTDDLDFDWEDLI